MVIVVELMDVVLVGFKIEGHDGYDAVDDTLQY